MLGKQQSNRIDEHLNVMSTDLVGLISDCIAQNTNAQRTMYDRYSPFIFGIIRRYTSNSNHAQEILNDAFYRILTRLESYSHVGSLEGWMRKVTVHVIADYYRKKSTKTDEYTMATEDSVVLVSENAISGINYKELLLMVHQLPDKQRAVFNLFVFENYTHREIAELLGLSENNCRWHLNDARRRLKENINKMYSDH